MSMFTKNTSENTLTGGNDKMNNIAMGIRKPPGSLEEAMIRGFHIDNRIITHDFILLTAG